MVAYHLTINGGTLPPYAQAIRCSTLADAEALAVHVAADVLRELDAGKAPTLQVQISDRRGIGLVVVQASVRRIEAP